MAGSKRVVGLRDRPQTRIAMKKSILVVAVWYFVALNTGGIISRRGPFPSKLQCETYRMRVSHYQPTSNCIQPQPTKKK